MFRRLRICVVVAAIALAVLAVPDRAFATAPTITSATSSGGFLTISWSLPAGMHSWLVEVATATDVESDGTFRQGNRVYALILTPGLTTITTAHLGGGTYYVHVSAYETCAVPGSAQCVKEFSPPRAVVVPPPSPPTLNSVGVDLQSVLTAKWSVPSTSRSDYIEIAIDPEVYADGPDKGAFLDENTLFLSDLSPGQKSYTTPAALSGGTYYVHVAAFDYYDCPTVDAPTCVDEFSDVLPIVVPSRSVTLTSARPSEHHISVWWSLPSPMESDYIEVATNPDVYGSGPLRGAFKGNVVYQDLLDYNQRSYVTFADFPPGTYYVHVADYAPAACDVEEVVACFDEYSDVAAVTISEAAGGPAPESLPAPLAQAGAAFSSLAVGKVQRVRELVVRAAMAERGTITASGSVSVPNSAKVYKLKRVTATVSPGAVVNLRLKLAKKDLRAVEKALRRYRRVNAKVTITARDMAGNIATKKRTIRLTN
jgi:hypothetical protein